ncbi:MAG: prephenate dehydratase domain-containing protein [Bacteroidales bacterium]
MQKSLKKLHKTGAIASTLAAEKYGLNILFQGIETNKMNYTRFLIVKDTNGNVLAGANANKSIISFSTGR